MSRWNALKPDDNNNNNFHDGGLPLAPRRINSRWTAPEKTARNQGNRQPLLKVRRTWDEIRTALVDAKDSDRLEKALREVADLNSNELCTIPAEQAASDIVESILLDSLSKKDLSSRLEQSILDAIRNLLQEPTICSAITNPLTVDVAQATGVEERIPNPVGEKLLLLLQERLPQSCLTLITVIDEIRKRKIADTLRVDFVRLTTFFSGKQHQQAKKLELLRLVLITYPGSYKSLQSLLLSDYRFNKKRDDDRVANECPTCSHKAGTSLLLDLMHCGQYTSQTTSCIALLVRSFPLNAWLNPKTAGSMQFFGQNVKADLIQLLKIMICQFSLSESFCDLTLTTLCTIPYTSNGKDPLTRQGINLVSCMANAIMIDPSPSHAVECLCECMGGRPRPNGGNTPTVLPVKLWLADASSFQEYLTTSADGRIGASAHYTASTKLLCAVVRTQPQFIAWQHLNSIIEINCTNAQRRVDAMNLLEKFALGRSEYLESLDQELISKFLIETVNTMSLDASRKVRQSCLQVYCAFLAVDWSYAAKHRMFEAIVQSLKHYCEKGNSSEKPLAFKAIGEMLSKCASESSIQDEYLSQVCITVLPVLINGLKESNPAPVRSMAVFAVGNLSLGIRERNSRRCILSPSNVLTLMELLCTSLSASNDKVAGNTIRTVGHLAHVAFHEPYDCQLESSKSSKCFRAIASKLTEKLRQAMGGISSSKLTWKERSSAKKHGWGACHSLGHLLDCDMAIVNVDHSREAYAALINCIKIYDILTEKIVLAAIVALQRLEPSRLASLSRRTGLVGLTVSFCLGLMVDDTSSVHQRIKSEVGHLLLRMLPILSVLDAQAVLQSETVSTTHLGWLYDWMLQHNLSAEPYEKFAIAFEQTNDWDGNISLEQRFASRAAWSYREECNSAEVANDLEEDEL